MDKTAVIVLHYKGEKDTRECLKSLFQKKVSRNRLNIIVVINSGSENFLRQLKEEFPDIVPIESKKNTGFAKGNNLGINKALTLDCENIILLNNDTIVGNSFIDEFVSFAEKDSPLGLLSPKIYFARGYEYHSNRYKEIEKGKVIWYAGGVIDWQNIYAFHRGVDEVDRGQFDQVEETDFATGCCMLIKKSVIKKIGLLDEKYFLYFEDVDYSIRARQNGFQVVYYPKVNIWHKNAASSDKPGSGLHIYYQTRNRFYFGFKYAVPRTKRALTIESIKMLFRGNMYQKAVIDFYLRKMGKGSI